MTDKAGQTVWASEYTPFGGKHSTEGELAHAAKFTGKDLDEDIGLYYFNARWYDQEIGRFISQDQLQDGLNWYSYCNNNPLIFIDPSGNLSQDANGNWQLDHWDMQFENGAFNYWRNDWFFTGEWWKDSAKLDSATAFLKYFDFEWKQNWVRGAFDGGKMRDDYTAADRYRVQTIQAIMGIDVTGFYDAKTYFAAGQLQMMYNIPNSKSGVFGTNTLLAAEALWSKDWKFEEFYMGIFDQQVGHFIVDTTLDLAFNYGIMKVGSLASRSLRTSLTNPLPEDDIFATVMPREFAEALASGKIKTLSGGPEAWITAASDLKGITTVKGAAQRLTLVDATGKLRLSSDTIVQFRLKDLSGIASPVYRTNPGYIYGGLTGGGAREWVILSNSDIEIIKIINLK